MERGLQRALGPRLHPEPAGCACFHALLAAACRAAPDAYSCAGEPNNDSPLNVSAAKLWDNQAEYRATLLRKAADQASS